jgi:hypothetical protein
MSKPQAKPRPQNQTTIPIHCCRCSPCTDAHKLQSLNPQRSSSRRSRTQQ